jgi:hypothetical protein
MDAISDDYYRSINGYFDWEHLYAEIADWLPISGAFCEIGMWRGQSLAYLLTQLKRINKPVRVVGVDHFQGSVEDPKLAAILRMCDVRHECQRNLDAIGYHYDFLFMRSDEASQFFRDGYFDCVFIDGSHDRASVTVDLRAWLPKVRQGGIIAGHDINQSGVRLALADVLPDAEVVERPRPEAMGGFQWGLCWQVQL